MCQGERRYVQVNIAIGFAEIACAGKTSFVNLGVCGSVCAMHRSFALKMTMQAYTFGFTSVTRCSTTTA
jgi:hypothetical protein